MPIASIGPSSTALGEADFMIAATSPARATTPRCPHLRWAPETRSTAIAVSAWPRNGTLRLWRKLPRMISEAAHTLPSAAARSHRGSDRHRSEFPGPLIETDNRARR